MPADRPTAVRLVLPWAVCVSDNLRKNPLAGNREAWRRYKQNRENARIVAMSQVRGKRPHFRRCAVRLTAELYEPDRRRRDVLGIAKALCDALEGVVYSNDYQIADSRWVRAGVNRRAPCVVLTVEPIEEAE